MKKLRFIAVSAVMFGAALWTGSSNAQDCNDLFDPNQVLTFNIAMDPADFETMRFSCPNGICPPPPDIYYPAEFECGASGPIIVGIRRKNDKPEPSEADPQKFSLKIDINLYVPGQLFAGKKKLSLECGSEGATVSQGMGWQLYQTAGGFVSGRSAWVKVYINGAYKGLYANVEQIDKEYLRDRGINDSGWLFKMDQQRTRDNPFEPNVFAFNWYPFDHPASPAEVPAPADWLTQTPVRINIPNLLALAAAENFVANTDGAVQKMNNFFYYDWSVLPNDDPAGKQPRLYLPWDLDTVMKDQETGLSVLNSGPGHMQQGLIEELNEAGAPFGFPTFKADYFTTYKAMLNGGLALSQTLARLNSYEPVISADMNADPFQQTGPAAAEFQRLRNFLTNRTASIVSQMSALGVGYPLQKSVSGNGTVAASANKETIYDAGEVVTLTATPDSGWQFVTWRGSIISTQNPVQITMNAPKSVTAFFAPVGQTLAVYDFSESAGVNRFAYGTYTDSWAEDLQGVRQRCPELCTLVTTIDPAAYTKLAFSDATGGATDPNRYINPDEGAGDESTLLVEFNIAQNRADVQRIDVLWEGYGDANHHMELYIWNYAQNNWGNGAGLFGDNNYMAHGSGSTDFTLAGSVTANVINYISATGQISLLVYDDAASERTFHDYVRVVVTVPQSCTPPTINTSPASQSACQDGAVTFNVSVTGTTPLSFQWRKGGINIPDATNPSFTINPVALSDAGSYDVVVTNACGSATSAEATLTVQASPTFTQQPQPQTVCQGSTAMFSIAANGAEPLSFQWQKNMVNLDDGGDISGTLTTMLTIMNVDAADAGDYRCVITDMHNCSADSNQAALALDTTDTDGDGTPDCIDGCPSDPNKTDPGSCGCGVPETAPDGDMNSDGFVNGRDVQRFVEALTSGAPTQNDNCHGNFDGMNNLDLGDIPGLVNVLLAVP